ncbi:helix-turn-helix transcriptional regulator [Litchfieldia salsa]|uniref:Predicted transcriptional regulator, ArsR family n=1 Tax=Litchfieldia salsa TaxID=930152 RepID=A0A1H0VD94_9BACI|nr:helix-turn-helix domain-containing protein [Litchfieldia salsa]SDP76205.1 Predicted transcriptional regulator, ArsR family [Litchfieldia salsa]
MEQTLKITNVLSDPTRYYIYQYVTKRHCEVTVQEIADSFNIHPNVARLHLSKLEDVNMLVSETKKTGKGGRPSRLYRLSDDTIQLHFPYRDYQLLAKIAIETMVSLGPIGKDALYQTGMKFGRELMKNEIPSNQQFMQESSFDEKLNLLKQAATLAGFYPEVSHNFEKTKIFFHVNNCPFKEMAKEHTESVCGMHYAFIQGMFEILFDNVELQQAENMMVGCDSCSYQAFITK